MNNFIILFCLINIFCSLEADAQTYLISFAGSGESTIVNTVKVDNLTSGTSRTLNGSQILRLNVTITDVNSIESKLSSELKIYPNPMTDNSIMQVYPAMSGNAVIIVSDINGKQIAQIKSYLDNYLQEFRLSGFPSGFYLVSVIGTTYQYSGKLISNGESNGAIHIEKVSNNKQTVNKKVIETNSKGEPDYVDMPYAPGDILKYTSISGDYSTVSIDTPASDKTVTFNFISCTDGDNNNYSVVEIGNQIWMAGNLKTTKYRDGTDIPLIVNNAEWGNLITAGYCWYNNEESTYKPKYGALYNWYTLNSGEVCPAGWHVPSNEELLTLTTFLGGESVAGGKLKETGISNWITPNAGATNETGFTALPGDARYLDGTYKFFGTYCHFWSSLEENSEKSWLLYLMNDWEGVANISADKNFGLSVRCLKDKVLKNEEAFPGVEGEIKEIAIYDDTITCEKINGEYVYQGDIILTEEQLGIIKGTALQSISVRWTNGIVYYEIDANLLNETHELIDAAIIDIESNTNLEFIERTDQENYVVFVSTNLLHTGTSSGLGMTGGKQKIWLEEGSIIKGDVIHEIGHTIGLVHEHSRSDRDNFIIIYWDNIKSSKKYNYEIAKHSFYTGTFDFESIMLYYSIWSSFAKDPSKPVITKKDGSTYDANREYLSSGDIEMINTLYGGSSPTALFSESKTNVSIGESIQFTDQSTGSPLYWSWNFGDGSHSTEMNPTHYYTSAGSYSVTLKVTNQFDTDSETKINYITVNSATCYSNLPNPVLTLNGIEEYTGSDGNQYIRYSLGISNYSSFPDDLFTPASDLPACGLNNQSSRTWVWIFDDYDNYIYGFCGLSSISNGIWFAVLKGTSPPSKVYIKLVDKRCSIEYTSQKLIIN